MPERKTELPGLLFSVGLIEEVTKTLDIPIDGLSEKQVQIQKERYGSNSFTRNQLMQNLRRIRRAFFNPFNVVLLILVLISLLSDFLPGQMGQSPSSHSQAATPILLVMIFISSLIRLLQEMKAKNAASQLSSMVQDEVTVKRGGIWKQIPAKDLVVGDRILLKAGARVPADVRLVLARDLYVSQAAVSGESDLLEKSEKPQKPAENLNLRDLNNICLMGSIVISGSGEGLVVSVGQKTLYGSFLSQKKTGKNAFEKGAASIAWVLLKFMACLIPLIFLILGLTGRTWLEAFSFALAASVGLVPEMLPMVITAALAKGSMAMYKKHTIVKDISAMQALGSMDVLCMDKTGTLTQENILLEYPLDVLGNESSQVLVYGYLNSLYHSGIHNAIDQAILACKTMPNHEDLFEQLEKQSVKLDDIPFDHNRRMVSVLCQGSPNLMIVKGDIQNVTRRCSRVFYKNEIHEISDALQPSISAITDEMLEEGMKVIAVAIKETGSQTSIQPEDEKDLTLVGYLAFFDAPKPSAASSVRQLQSLHVRPVVLSGDSRKTTLSICKRVGLDSSAMITGQDLNQIKPEDLPVLAEKVSVFAELTPAQKAEIVRVLQNKEHTVGYLGDGLNDIPAMSLADAAISVESAVDACREFADVVLLEKDLTVLSRGILEGRKTFANMAKYVKITASSNFGNILSIVFAAVFLPFLPMASIQILLLNLLYDALCIVLPWDNVDEEQTLSSKGWSSKSLSRFMLAFGPISTLFDIAAFLFLYFVLCPMILKAPAYASLDAAGKQTFIELFQTGWFLESLWTQVLVLFFLRTSKIPFQQSRPSWAVLLITLGGILIFTGITFTKSAALLGLRAMPPVFFVYLLMTCLLYMGLIALMKSWYQKRYNELL